jgi:hypothetical protein
VIAYQLAGRFWLIVGLFLAGVGVVLVAAIASLIYGEWLVLIQIVIAVAIVYGLRILGSWLIEKSEPKDEYEPSRPILMPKGAERIVQQYGAALARGSPDDPLFHQRVYTLAGLEYGPSVENGYLELYLND